MLPLPLYTRGEVRRRLGRLAEAAADASETIALSEDTGQSSKPVVARWLLALIDAVQGRSGDCQAQVDGMLSLKGPSEAEGLRIYSGQALGFLALGAGDIDEAVHHLMAVNRLYRETSGAHPLIDHYEQNLIEVSAPARPSRGGRRRAVAANYRPRRAQRHTLAHGCGGAATGTSRRRRRVRGTLRRGAGVHARTPTPFEARANRSCAWESVGGARGARGRRGSRWRRRCKRSRRSAPSRGRRRPAASCARPAPDHAGPHRRRAKHSHPRSCRWR